jgi:hypothetical protein
VQLLLLALAMPAGTAAVTSAQHKLLNTAGKQCVLAAALVALLWAEVSAA